MTPFHELSTEQQLVRVSSLMYNDLLAAYRSYFPGSAEHPRSYIQRKLAYRVQELAYGGLDAVTANKAREAKRDLKDATPGSRLVNRTPLPGTRLTRDYRGQRYGVKFDGTRLFPERVAYTANYKLSEAEAQLYNDVTAYVKEEMNRADQLDGKRKGTVGFALTALQRRLASSPEAILQRCAN
jgi:hypothetical protein